ncbi:MAG TPA: hypothetical protein VHI13_00535 [Candidatus Kapabacteria bacterium]|nr:hypothetical protein [Candidatus Kapabacteria bacterium]
MINRSFSLLALVLVLTACPGITSVRAQATRFGGHVVHGDSSPEHLRAAIDSGIVMLESQHYRDFLDRFVEPSRRTQMMEGMEMEAKARQFGMEKADMVLEALKSIRRRKPVVAADGSLATFKLPKKIGSHRTIEFTRVDGVWYLRN